MEKTLSVSEFLQAFPTPPHPILLHRAHPHRMPLQRTPRAWAFSSGSENNPSSAAADIDNKILSSFLKDKPTWRYICQFWAPVTVGCRRLLSTSGRPFVVGYLSKELAMYRQYSEKYKYAIDMHVDNEPADPMIIGGGPATAFLRRSPCVNQLHWTPSESGVQLIVSFMLPICCSSVPSSSTCIGVLEFTTTSTWFPILSVINDLKQAGVDMPDVQELIPYKTIKGLQLAKDEIDEALRVVCGSHKLALAQVWIAYEDENRVSMEETRKKRLLALKLAGHASPRANDGQKFFHRFCSAFPLAEEGLALKTLEDYKSRYTPNLPFNMMLMGWKSTCFDENSVLTICLRSNDTLDIDYAFEFIWVNDLNSPVSLEAILLTLGKCLPRFKFASGAEIGDELDVIVVNTPISLAQKEKIAYQKWWIAQQKFMIAQGKRSSPVPEEGAKPIVMDNIAPLEVTSPKVLFRQVIERQFGQETVENFHGSGSTMKRNLRDLMPPGTLKKRKANDLSIIRINANDNGSILDASSDNINQTLTLKAEYGDDIILLVLPVSQADFASVEKAIGMKLKLSVGTYKLQYLDEDKNWICLANDEDMGDCIKCSRIRLRVLSSLNYKLK